MYSEIVPAHKVRVFCSLAYQLEQMRDKLSTFPLLIDDDDELSSDDESEEERPPTPPTAPRPARPARPARRADRPAPPAGGIIEYLSGGGTLMYKDRVDGKRQGEACLTCSQGHRTVFFFVDGVRQGPAATFYPDDSAIAFSFKDDLPEGPALEVEPAQAADGGKDVLLFNYLHGVRQGRAHGISSKDQVMHFTYVNDVKQGSARCIKLRTKAVLSCNFVDDVAQGKAYEKWPDGTVYELEYRDGYVIRGPTPTISMTDW